MSERDSSDDIERTAALWAVRIDDDALSPDQDVELSEWLRGDRRRPGALLRAQAGLAHVDRARALGPDGLAALECDEEPRRGVSRRMMFGGAAAIAATVAATIGLGIWPDAPALDYRNRRGEIRSIALSDGSAMTLDTLSSARVTMRTGSRGVTLNAGRALFDVARDAARPFVVEAGEVRVRAVGTSFAVDRQVGGGLQVLVSEGLVEVTSQAGGFQRSLAAHHALTLSPDGKARITAADQATIERTLAWRNSVIELDGVTLGAAAAEFARYSDYAIVVDPAVAGLRVTGRYSAFDARGFASAAAASLGITADVGNEGVRLRP